MLPDIAASICSSVGFGFVFNNAAADMICRLAITALGDILLQPGLLHRVISIRGKSFDSRNLFIRNSGYGQRTRSHCTTFEVNSTRSTLSYSTSILGSHKLEVFTKYPEEGSFWINIHCLLFAVDV
jgi:hypothetical protein